MNCPKCACEYAYQDGALWICPECAHEWSAASEPASASIGDEIRDANGVALASGDTVALVKDLKVKGSSSTVKSGAKVKNIRLVVDPVDGHDIACKIEGIGAMYLKSEFVKKV
jgi:protein PhnA